MLGFILDSARNNMLVSGLWGLFLIHFHFPRVYKVRGNSVKIFIFHRQSKTKYVGTDFRLDFHKNPPFPPVPQC